MEDTFIKDTINYEEIWATTELLQDWLAEHDDNRARVQEMLDEACNKLREQLESMVNSVTERLEESFKKEDTQTQEVLSGLLRLSNPDEEKDDEERAKLAELMTRAKAILLVKQSYELRKPKKPRKWRELKFPEFDDDGVILDDFGINGFNIDDFRKDMKKVMEEEEEEDKKDPDLSKLYELEIRSEVVEERLCVRTPRDLKVVKVGAGRVYLSFIKPFNAEEERILSDHNLKEDVIYRAAIRMDGSDKWFEHIVTAKNTGKEGTEYSFSPVLLSDTMFFVKVGAELKGHKSEWSECASFVPTFSESCGWRECTTKGPDGGDAYFISEENPMIVKSIKNHEELEAISTISLPQNRVSSWSFRIVDLLIDYGANLFVGVSCFDEDNNAGLGIDGISSKSWYFDCSTFFPCIYYRGFYDFAQRKNSSKTKWVCTNLDLGDTLGIVMDTSKGELSFVVNEVNFGVAFDDIPLDKPLFPSIRLGNKGISAELILNEVQENPDSTIPAPSNITVKPTGWDTLELSWDSVDGALFYQVEMDGSNFWNQAQENTSTFSRLAPDSEHSFRVRAVKGYRPGEWSEIVGGQTKPLPDFSECVWKMSQEHAQIFIGGLGDRMQSPISQENPRIVTCPSFGGFANVTGDVMLLPNKVTSWNIKILSTRNLNINLFNNYAGGVSGLLVGVAPIYQEEWDYQESNYNGWYFDCSALKLESGPPHKITGKAYGPQKGDGEYIHAGDSVGVIMDMTRGDLSFVIDGVDFGVAYEGIPLDRPLTPAVILTKPGYSVELDLSEVRLNMVSSSLPPPESIVVKNSAWDSITLAWDPVKGASAYQIEVDGEGQCFKTTNSNYTVSGLLQGTEHTLRVRTVQKGEVSEWSSAVTGRTEDEYPDFSECVWREAANGAGYEVDKETKRIATKSSIHSACRVLGSTPLSLNKVVSWSVKVLKTQNNRGGSGILVGVSPYDGSDDSNKRSFGNRRTVYFNCSTRSIQTSAEDMSIKARQMNVPKNSLKAGQTVGVVMDTAKGEIEFLIDEVRYGVIYKGIPLDKPLVPCVVLSNNGDSVELDISEVKENVSSSVPTPQGITVSKAAWDSITLGWGAVEDTAFYQVEVDGVLQRKTTTMCSFTKEGLLAESEHRFRARSVKERGVSEWSEAIEGRTLSAPDFSECVWKEFTGDVSQGNYSVDEVNHRIATRVSGAPFVLGSAPLPANKACSWSIKILSTQVGRSAFIGVAVSANNKDEVGMNRWTISCSDLTLLSVYNNIYDHKEYEPWSSKRRRYVNTEDVVGVVMDTTKGELSFVLNGINLGVAFEGIPLDKPLVPCFYFGGNEDSVELDLSEVEEKVDGDIAVPTGVVAESKACDTITLSWDAFEGASFYQVEVDGCSVYNVPLQLKSSFSVRGLLAGTEHTFRVRSLNEDRAGGWSDLVKGRTLAQQNFSGSVWRKFPGSFSAKAYLIDESNKKIVTRVSLDGMSNLQRKRLFISGSTPIPLNAVTSWSVKILKSLNNDGGDILIGVSRIAVDPDNDSVWCLGCYFSELFSKSVGEGKKPGRVYGPRKKEGEYVRTGDSVGAIMDTANGELSFILNRANLGVAYEGIPLDKPLFPCVSLGKDGDSVELVV